MNDTKPVTYILIVFIITFAIRVVFNRLYDPTIYKGEGYSVKMPKGWEKKEEPNELIMLSPAKDPATGIPEAMFSVYSKKSSAALFLDDLFEEVLTALGQEKGEILEKGDIAIDKEQSKWIIFKSRDPAYNLMTFYIVDPHNRFIKIQYLTMPGYWKKYRDAFEVFKNSIRFKRLF